MSEFYTQCLDQFPEWLHSLAADVAELAQVINSNSIAEGPQRYVIGGLSYVLKSLDIIADGVMGIGFLDDALTLRVAASLALREDPAASSAVVLVRLASDTKLIAGLLSRDYTRLEFYVRALSKGMIHGETIDKVIHNDMARAAFLQEIGSWVSRYQAPTVTLDEEALIELQSFLMTKLPN